MPLGYDWSISEIQAQMQAHGFVCLKNYFDAQQLQLLRQEALAFIEIFYNSENLSAHSVYPSDSSETRVSHAVMIAEGDSALPKVDHKAFPTIDLFLKRHNLLLQGLSGQPVAPGARCMLNYQNYFSGSKPVGEHFDGEYLRAQKAEDGVEFQLLEGILPRYVAVLVAANENQGKGIEILDNQSKTVAAPVLNAGDIIILDNIFKRHRVPQLDHPRTSIGLRSFDHQAWHFAATPEGFIGDDYQAIAEGWVSDSVDCQARFQQYLANEWPEVRDQYTHYV